MTRQRAAEKKRNREVNQYVGGMRSTFSIDDPISAPIPQTPTPVFHGSALRIPHLADTYGESYDHPGFMVNKHVGYSCCAGVSFNEYALSPTPDFYVPTLHLSCSD